jgi:hypothetical protein
MHRLPSQSAVVRFRVSAYLLVFASLLFLGSLGLLGYSFFFGHRDHLILGSILIGTAIVILIVQWISAARARCPLCLTPSLSKKSCSKNRGAQRFLGSYRLKVATSIIFTNSFRCPYCNEPTVLEVRQRKAR